MQQDLPRAETCGSITELRRAIDALDARLVALLALRQTYIERAAILKSERGAVRDAARVEQVVRNVVADAGRLGLSPAIAETVWRALVEASIAHEYGVFDAKSQPSA